MYIVTVSCNANFKIQTLLIVKKQCQVMVRLVKAVQKMSAKVAVINVSASCVESLNPLNV